MFSMANWTRHFIPEHPLEILVHAIKHDYPKLIDEVAPLLILHPQVPMMEKLPLDLLLPWVRTSFILLAIN